MKIDIYSEGIVHMSVCAPKEMTIEEITKEINEFKPNGISTDWVYSDDEFFHGGKTNPCQCEQDENRMHYLFKC